MRLWTCLSLAWCAAASKKKSKHAAATPKAHAATATARAGPPKKFDWGAALKRVDEYALSNIRQLNASTAPEHSIRAAIESPLTTIWIFDGRLFVHEAFVKAERGGKSHLHLRFMWSLLKNTEARKAIGNVVYQFNKGAGGGTSCDPSIARLGIAKQTDDESHCEILVPNPYFGDLSLDWGREYDKLYALGNKKVWRNRDKRAFWRGTIGQLTGGKGDRSTGDYIHDLHHGMGCRHESGNYARLQGCGLTNAYPKQFDVKWVRHCTPRPIKSLRNDNCRDVLPRKSYPVTCAGLPSGHYASHTTYVQYQYLLDMPGSTTGSYSWNLNHLWPMGSVVLFWAGPLINGSAQWYTPALEEGRTHVTIAVENASAIVGDLADDKDRVQDLLANARGIAERFICPKCLVRHVSFVLASIRKQQPKLDAVLNPRTSRPTRSFREILADTNCEKTMRLVEVTRGRLGCKGGGRCGDHGMVYTKAQASGRAACDFLSKMSKK